MELEQARRLWQQEDARYMRQLDATVLRRSRLARADSEMKRLARGAIFELLFDVAFVMLLGAFIANHVHERRFVIPAVVFDLYAIAALASVVRQVVMITAIDFDAPIVAIQQKLELLRILRLRTVQWTVLLAPLMWTPLLIVGLRGLFSVDAYVTLGPEYLVANALVGVVVLGAGALGIRRFSGRLDMLPLLKRIADTLEGRSIAEARLALSAITSFGTIDVP